MVSSKTEDSEKPEVSSSVNNTTNLSLRQREQKVLMAAWLSIKGAEPQVDYDSMAKILGLKNGHTANTVFYNVKKKIRQFRSRSGETFEPPTTPVLKTPSTPHKRASKDPAVPKSGRSAKRVKSEGSTAQAPDLGEEGEI